MINPNDIKEGHTILLDGSKMYVSSVHVEYYKRKLEGMMFSNEILVEGLIYPYCKIKDKDWYLAKLIVHL